MAKYNVYKSRSIPGKWFLNYPDGDIGYFPSWVAAMAAIDKIEFRKYLKELTK